MDSHPLNLAHQQYRRAEAHVKNNRFDDAIQCHQNAAELLLEAMKISTSSVALESLSIQHNYHLKQKDVIKQKKERYLRVKKSMEHMKLLSRDPCLDLQSNDHSKLQIAIFKALNDSDALLDTLSSKNEEAVKKNMLPEYTLDGRKKEKPQELVVEELQILSQNLHSLVEQLVLKVEVLKDENMSLSERVNYLEKERVKYLNISTKDEFISEDDFATRGNFSQSSSSNLDDNVDHRSNPSPDQTSKQIHFDFSVYGNKGKTTL